jgi:hypothetical protein
MGYGEIIVGPLIAGVMIERALLTSSLKRPNPHACKRKTVAFLAGISQRQPGPMSLGLFDDTHEKGGVRWCIPWAFSFISSSTSSLQLPTHFAGEAMVHLVEDEASSYTLLKDIILLPSVYRAKCKDNVGKNGHKRNAMAICSPRF